jgi:hypothetical protein
LFLIRVTSYAHIFFSYLIAPVICGKGPGERSRCSQSLRAGVYGDRIPVWGESFRTLPDRPWDPLSVLCNGYRVFPGGKATGAWHWPNIPSSAEVEGRVEPDCTCTSAHPLGLRGLF